MYFIHKIHKMSSLRYQIINQFFSPLTDIILKYDYHIEGISTKYTDINNMSDVFAVQDDILAMGNKYGVIKIWNIKTHQCVELREHTRKIIYLGFTLDNHLISTALDHTIKIWDLKSNKSCISIQNSRSSNAFFAHIRPDGQLLSICESGKIKLWNVNTHQY